MGVFKQEDSDDSLDYIRRMVTMYAQDLTREEHIIDIPLPSWASYSVVYHKKAIGERLWTYSWHLVHLELDVFSWELRMRIIPNEWIMFEEDDEN